jgi:hypothetical protein
MPVFNNLPKNSQRLAAWAAAGAVFGLWTWWDQREDGTVMRQDEVRFAAWRVVLVVACVCVRVCVFACVCSRVCVRVCVACLFPVVLVGRTGGGLDLTSLVPTNLFSFLFFFFFFL